jgi:hypothetical protein
MIRSQLQETKDGISLSTFSVWQFIEFNHTKTNDFCAFPPFRNMCATAVSF